MLCKYEVCFEKISVNFNKIYHHFSDFSLQHMEVPVSILASKPKFGDADTWMLFLMWVICKFWSFGLFMHNWWNMCWGGIKTWASVLALTMPFDVDGRTPQSTCQDCSSREATQRIRIHSFWHDGYSAKLLAGRSFLLLCVLHCWCICHQEFQEMEFG